MGEGGPKYLKTSDVGLKNQNGISRKLERHCSSGPINLDISHWFGARRIIVQIVTYRGRGNMWACFFAKL